MALKKRVILTMYSIVCDRCGRELAEKSTGIEAQAEANRLGFHWTAPDNTVKYDDLCPVCYAAIQAKVAP